MISRMYGQQRLLLSCPSKANSISFSQAGSSAGTNLISSISSSSSLHIAHTEHHHHHQNHSH